METTVEELAPDKVRLNVEVPSHHVRHAIDHAAEDLAVALKIPGFRKGKVPMQVLMARVGRERVYTEAVESHIGGWFWNAAATTRIRPVEQPQYGYELPASPDQDFRFTATVAVQPIPAVADWTTLEVPAPEAEVPAELVDQQLEALRESVAELVPVEDRPAMEADTVVVDLIDPSGEAQRDYVVKLGSQRLLPEIEDGLIGMQAGESKTIEIPLEEGDPVGVEATMKEIKESKLPPLDDDLARTASEFDTLGELRDDLESGLREQLQEELENAFRQAAVDALVDASKIEVSEPLVNARAGELLQGLLASLQERGVNAETYLALTNQTPEALQDNMREQARRSIARELALEGVAEQLGIQTTDAEVEELVRREAAEADEDADAIIERLRESGRWERLREDLRLRAALDRVVADVKRIPVELARAREKLWTPEEEKSEPVTKLWTPGSKEPA